MAFALRQRGQTIRHQDPNQYADYLAGTTSQTVTRSGDSTSLYADTLVQRDSTNGYIARAGYGTAGFETWMLEITKNKVVIKKGVIYCQGPTIYDVEAYANASDLNDDGSFKIDVDASVAWNLAADAIRDADIFPGGFGWASGRALRYNSPIYLIEHTLKFIDLNSVTIAPSVPGMITNLYSGNSWAGPPAGTPGALAGMTAAQSPMVDCTGMGGTTIWGMQLYAQVVLDEYPAPSVRPAVGWLVGPTQTYSGSAWGGTNGNSGNNSFMSCGSVGWAKYADWAMIGTVLTTMHACSGQNYSNEANSMSLYVGCTVLNTSGDPDRTGTAFDSVWYPEDASPAASQERLLRTAAGGGVETGGTATEIVIIRSEFHDMYPNVAVADGGSSDAQTNKKRTVLIHRVNGLKMLDVPISGSGVAQIELYGQCQNLDFEMCQNYNKGGTNARTNYFIRCMGFNDSNPIKGLRITNLLGTTAPQIGWVGAGTNSADDSPCFVYFNVHDNNMANTVPFFKTLASYSGAAGTVNLSYSDIDLVGCDYEFGGSLDDTSTLRNIGASEQWGTSGSNGTNAAARYYADGTVSFYAGVTTRTGNVTASTGHLTGRHVVGNGTTLVAGDFALNANWGTTGAVSAVRGTDMACTFTVTPGGTGISNNPTVTLTFKHAFSATPNVFAQMNAGTGAASTVVFINSVSTTSVVLQPLFTPTTAVPYTFTFFAFQ